MSQQILQNPNETYSLLFYILFISRNAESQLIPIAQPLTTTPPFGCKHWPEMKLLSWLARKTKQVATSLGCPGRPIGVPLNCSCAEVDIVAGIKGVQTIIY